MNTEDTIHDLQEPAPGPRAFRSMKSIHLSSRLRIMHRVHGRELVPSSAQMPLDVIAEHAEKHISPSPRLDGAAPQQDRNRTKAPVWIYDLEQDVVVVVGSAARWQPSCDCPSEHRRRAYPSRPD